MLKKASKEEKQNKFTIVILLLILLLLLFLLSLNKCSYFKGELKSGQQILGYAVEKVCELKKKYMYCTGHVYFNMFLRVFLSIIPAFVIASENIIIGQLQQRWHELKHFLLKVHKPYSKEELINGITKFWSTVTENGKWTQRR